jgi:hypothetical protein
MDQLDCTFVRLEDLEVLISDKMDKLIDSKITEFIQMLDQPAGSKKYQISLQFYEKKPKKSWFTKEDDSWEEWTIHIAVTRAKTEREQIHARNQLKQDLHQLLMKISVEAGSKRNHIPAIINSDPFPFQVFKRLRRLRFQIHQKPHGQPCLPT